MRSTTRSVWTIVLILVVLSLPLLLGRCAFVISESTEGLFGPACPACSRATEPAWDTLTMQSVWFLVIGAVLALAAFWFFPKRRRATLVVVVVAALIAVSFFVREASNISGEEARMREWDGDRTFYMELFNRPGVENDLWERYMTALTTPHQR